MPKSNPFVPPRPFSNSSLSDFDQDGEVGLSDFTRLAIAFGSTDQDADLDGDGLVGFSDFIVFSRAYGWKSSGVESITVELPGGETMEMVRVEPGSYLRGASPEHEAFWIQNEMWDDHYFDDELPAHLVSISKPFYLGKSEVT